MEGQVRGQGKVRQTQTMVFCKIPLLHWHQKRIPIPCLFHEFNLDAIEKNYSQDPPLSIHLKSGTLPPCVVCMYYVMSNRTPKFWCVQLPSTPNPKWRKGVWREDSWCGGKDIGVAAAPPLKYHFLYRLLLKGSETRQVLLRLVALHAT